MVRAILERERELAVLAGAARAAATGQGSVALVYGEAGIGKSSLVDAVRGQLPAEGRMLLGRCDDLTAARTLGPFRDLVGSVGTELVQALRDGTDHERLLAAVRGELDGTIRPTLLAIEDVHWADDATLDVLRYLVRRIADLPAVLLLTFRDDELGDDHPLHQLLALIRPVDHRLPLRRLSIDAVRTLSADSRTDADEVFAVTSGNPFFVTEVIQAGAHATGIPRTVVDTVLARLGGLDDATRDAVEQLSVVPTAIDRQLVDELVAGGLATLEPAEERGLLRLTTRRVAFRHELTRRAVMDALPWARRAALNARVLAALERRPHDDLARLVHHAVEAGDREAIVRYGSEAALSAAQSGAHREAVKHYDAVLGCLDAFEPATQAELLQAYSIECHTVGRNEQAVSAQRQSIELRRGLADPTALGNALRWYSRALWWIGDRRSAEVAADEAIDVLEAAAGSPWVSLAYSNRAQLHNVLLEAAAAVPVAERAVELAQNDAGGTVLAVALNNLDRATWQNGEPDDGRAHLEEALRLAVEANDVELIGRARFNLAYCLLEDHRLDDAAGYLDPAGFDLMERAEYLSYVPVGRALLSMIELYRCHWDDAVRYARQGLGANGQLASMAATALNRVKVRTDQPDDRALHDEWQRAVRLDQLPSTAFAAATLCEAAWLRGDLETIRRVGGPAYEEACRLRHRTLPAELGFFLAEAGESPSWRGSGQPYELLAKGEWREAARKWAEYGYPYEHALALAQSGDEENLLLALEKLDEIDAKPLASVVRRKLRDLGVARIPRGPQPATRHQPAGLTQRQVEVLDLLAEDLSNAEIASRLGLSARTVGNHLAAIFAKLEVHGRREAIEWSRAFRRRSS